MFSFLSLEFTLMFIGFLAIYWLFRQTPKFQNFLIILFSYTVIYLMAGTLATGILFGYTIFVFFIAEMINGSKIKKFWLILGIAITLIQLSIFKYYDFFREGIKYSLDAMQLDSSGVMANIIFPLGISYYSFQAISYLVSRYYDECDVSQLSFMALLHHLSFFGTISAGPIARTKSVSGLTDIEGNPCGMSEQIISQNPRRILFPTIALCLILLALIKKWWLAGWLADHWVNPIFANPMQYHSLEVLVAIYGYTLQLFLDFSGYSEMMVAFGLLLGFRLPVNFKAPLIAHNIRVFWDRWHISLSTWIRDYIYIPLGGSRQGFFRTQINLLIAMALSGIWHGSSVNFLLWGVLHGLAIIWLNCTDKLYQNLHAVDAKHARNALYRHSWLGKVIGIFVTIHFVVFCFVFFRATSWTEAMQIFEALAYNHTNIAWSSNPLFMLALFMIAWFIYPIYTRQTLNIVRFGALLPKPIIISLLFVCLMIVVIFAPSGIPGFIYANF